MYSKTGKLTLRYIKWHPPHVLSESPLVVQIDGDSYNPIQLSNSLTVGAYNWVMNKIESRNGTQCINGRRTK